MSAGIVTRMGPGVSRDALPGIEMAGRPSARTTSFENEYSAAGRRQRVPEQADALDIEDVPESWRTASIVLVGPVCGEVPASLTAALESPLVGVSAQGWLRELDAENHVQRSVWNGPPFWPGAHVLFVSREDIAGLDAGLERWTAEVPVVVETRDRGGARVHEDGGWRAIEAFPADELDPTGAGDVFASAFLVRYGESNDTRAAARFAAAAAACAVEGEGIGRIATREAIEQRMAAHQEIDLG
jgi:sugar/nucleoside kinase (ribokinase family)